MNIICALGLLPWMYHFCNIFLNNPTTFHKFIPLLIFVNVVSYHIFYSENQSMFLLDTLSNIFFIGYINVNTYNQPETFLCTMLSMTAYCFNKLLNKDVLHVALIQWLLLFAYIKSYKYEYAHHVRYIELSNNIDLNQIVEIVYNILDKYAEKVLRIEYEDIDLLLSIDDKRIKNFDDFTNEPGNNEEPNIVQDVTTEIECPTNELAVRGDDQELRHE